MSVEFLSATPGPEMAAPILWAPRISVFFLQENLHVYRIPRFRGGGRILGFGGEGGWSADFIFMGTGICEVVSKTHRRNPLLKNILKVILIYFSL